MFFLLYEKSQNYAIALGQMHDILIKEPKRVNLFIFAIGEKI